MQYLIYEDLKKKKKIKKQNHSKACSASPHVIVLIWPHDNTTWLVLKTWGKMNEVMTHK